MSTRAAFIFSSASLFEAQRPVSQCRWHWMIQILEALKSYHNNISADQTRFSNSRNFLFLSRGRWEPCHNLLHRTEGNEHVVCCFSVCDFCLHLPTSGLTRRPAASASLLTLSVILRAVSHSRGKRMVRRCISGEEGSPCRSLDCPRRFFLLCYSSFAWNESSSGLFFQTWPQSGHPENFTYKSVYICTCTYILPSRCV